MATMKLSGWSLGPITHLHNYTTADSKSQVLQPDYFAPAASKLKLNHLIHVTCAGAQFMAHVIQIGETTVIVEETTVSMEGYMS